MKKLLQVAGLFLVGAALNAFGAAGDTYVWTGAEDGRWMNAANWTLNGNPATVPPGVPMSEVTTSAAKVDTILSAGLARKGEKVEFGPIATANTTIDFDGLYSIGQITVKAGAPTYTFGTSSSQIVPIESGSKLILESELENMPVMTAVFSFGAAATTRDTTVYIENNTDREFTLYDIGDVRSTTADTWGFSYLYLRGTGNVRFAGSHVYDQGKVQTGLRIDTQVPKVTVAAALEYVSALGVAAANANIEILKDCRVVFSTLNSNRIYATKTGGSITGEGLLQFKGGPTKEGTNRARFDISKNCELEIAVAFDMIADYGTGIPDVNLYGNNNVYDQNGTAYFSGTNRALGAFAFIDGDRICKVGPEGLTADGTVRFYASGTLATVWTNAATLTRTFAVSNGCTACIGNAGTGTLMANLTVTTLGENASVWLGAKALTDSIDLNASLPADGDIGLLIDGAATVRPSSATLAGVAAICLKGGMLDASAIPNWSPTVPVTFDTGAATITVPDGETYVFSSLARTAGKSSGTLNIACGTGRVKIAGASAGAAPTGVTVNGLAAEIRDDGMVVPVVPATDVHIAARGDVVPNAPAQTVGIMTDGTGGNDTLATSATAVKALVHGAAADATVEIGENANLAAAKVTLAGFAGNLDIGANGDLGTFGAEGSEVQLENLDTATDLKVNARLAKDVRVVVDGSVRAPILAGGSVGTNSIVTKTGMLKVAGARTLVFDLVAASTNRQCASANPADWPTVRFDGAKDVVIGERGMHAGYAFMTSGYSSEFTRGRIVVTNSLLRNENINRAAYPKTDTWTDEFHSIVVGNRCSGLMEIQEGAVISNRLVVGAPMGGNRAFGAVWQTGGEMAALGDYSGNPAAYSSGIGITSGEGFYALSGGRLVSLGRFAIGHGSACGILRQTGGVFAVGRHPANVSGTEYKDLNISGGNSGEGLYWISGGKCDAEGSILMSGGYYSTSSSRAILTVDGTATFDAHENGICMVNTGNQNYKLSYPHHSTVNINGGGTLRAAGFNDRSRDPYNVDPTNRFVAVGFNGGTFKTGADSKAIFHDNSSWLHGSAAYSIDHVIVYSGGMTVDTDGKTGNFIDVPLEGASGGGVVAVDFVPPAAYQDFHIPPFVSITGDGVGATAAVDWDPATRTIKGVTILSAGIGYTYATANFHMGPPDNSANRQLYAVEMPCTIAANANTGSFTKKGEGDLTLEAVNTYGGDTVLAGGVLRVAVTGALPDGSALVPQGGILEVSSGVTLPGEITVKLQNPDKSAKYDIIRFAGDVPATLPAFTIEGTDSSKWRVVTVGKTLRVSYNKGFKLIFR